MAASLMRLLARLPLPWLHRLGVVAGLLAYLIPNQNRAIAERNLERCFPELDARQRRSLLRRTLMEIGKTAFETTFIWFAKPRRVRAAVRAIPGREHLDAALAAGRGVVLVVPHLGSWELVSLYAAEFAPITCLYRPLRIPALEGLVRKARERLGSRLVPTNPKGVRALLKTLHDNEMVGIPPDQDPRDSGGAFAPFFGIDANTMTLIPRLIQKSGATALLAVGERLPGGAGFRLNIRPIEEELEGDPQVAVAAINRAVEEAVRALPEQYQWIYKRFRTRPAGEPPFY